MSAAPQFRHYPEHDTNYIGQFYNVIQTAGLTPPDSINADGKLHRFSSNGKRGDDAGWYVLHGDGIPAGSFGDWRTGFKQTWRADIGRKLTSAEEKAHRDKVTALRRAHKAEQAKRRKEAKAKASEIWKKAKPAPDNHPYLVRKSIQAHGLRVTGNRLVVPVGDNNTLHSLQFISLDGTKRFLTGGRTKGCYFGIGDPADAEILCIAEGVATGATIHEATGLPVIMAFNAGNLGPVTKALHKRLPDAALIVCADDDTETEGNPGKTKAKEAARAVGAVVALPDFGSGRPDKATDFNDMAAHCGPEAVAQVIRGLVESDSGSAKTDVTNVTDVQASNDGPSGVTSPENQDVTDVTPLSPIPGLEDRPKYCVFDDWVESGGVKYRSGVWYFGVKDPKGNNDEPILTSTWIASPLYVRAVTLDGQDNNYGRLLYFRNTARRWREWAMPMELLRGSGEELRGELLSMGVEIDPHSRYMLGQYLQAFAPKRQIRCATQTGWCDGSYVLPDEVVGPKASDVIFQSGERDRVKFTCGGTLKGWRDEIAARAVNNPMLVLALSASFVGPLLAKCNAEGGGIHFVGDSSIGKTVAVKAACATWGGKDFMGTWRATANGMEGAAALSNDGLLTLDEINQCDPRQVGEIVYTLGNGIGKQRANRSGRARGVNRWCCFVLSSGERTIETTMAEGGHRVKAGQLVRLLNIPVLRQHGAWDDLHGLPSGAVFSDALMRAAKTNHGHAGRAFLEKLTRDNGDFFSEWEKFKAGPEFAAEGGEGQHKRAAARFALLALAGELATDYDITGWPEGAALQAAAAGFQAWQSLRGRGNDERRQVLEQVSDFIERNGDARFSDVSGDLDDPVRERAGWWHDEGTERIYLFNSSGLHEALKGHEFKRGLDVLQDAGVLPQPDSSGERSKPTRIGKRSVRVYPIHADKLGAAHGC